MQNATNTSTNARRAAVLALLAGAVAIGAPACSSSSSSPAAPPPPGDASYALPPLPDAGDDSADGDDEGPQAYVRIAAVSPDAPPLDVCVAPHGTGAFQGPLVAQLAVSLAVAAGAPADAAAGGDAGAPGLSFGQVSAYVPLAPGQYDVRLVPAGAASCDAPLGAAAPIDGGAAVLDVVVDAAAGDGGPGGDQGDASPADASLADASPADASLADAGSSDAAVDGGARAAAVEGGADAASGIPDWDGLPSIAADTYTTLLVAGDLSPAGGDAPLGVFLRTDDAVLAGGAASLRAIDAVPSAPSLDFGLGSGAAWMPLLVDVPFAGASAEAGPGQGAVDANGYIPIPPLSAQAVSARASASDAGTDVATSSSVEIDVGSIATTIAIGGKTGDAAHPPALLFCVDNQPSGGLLSDCSVEP